jgi:hypothetical protein
MTTSGAFTEYTVTAPYSGLSHIALGPDGNLWFTIGRRNTVDKFNPNE